MNKFKRAFPIGTQVEALDDTTMRDGTVTAHTEDAIAREYALIVTFTDGHYLEYPYMYLDVENPDNSYVRKTMRAGKVIISVWNCQAIVSRYEEQAGTFEVIACENWKELEEDAITEVENQNGAINMSAHYACSSELATRAVFSKAL